MQLDAAGHGRVAAAALADVADALAHAVRFAAQVAAGDGRFAAGGRQQRREHAQGGGLAGAVGAEEAEDFAGVRRAGRRRPRLRRGQRGSGRCGAGRAFRS